MNTNTKHVINADIYIRTNADTCVNHHSYLHFHTGINSAPIPMRFAMLYTNNDINIIHSSTSTATIHIFGTVCFEDRN